MVIFLSIVIVILLSILIIIGIALNRSIVRIQHLENTFENMYNSLGMFAKYCEAVLNKPIYANEPVIIELVSQMRNLHKFLVQVESFYTFDIQLDPANYLPKEDDVKTEN